MKTTPKALKGLYTALGGSSPIADESKTVDVLNAISTKIGGDGGATRVPDAIDNIAAKADDLVIPTGKLSITGTAEVDCSAYAKAQVSSATLLAENIKKDVNILGVTGSYEGGGGSSDFSTAEVTINVGTGISNVVFNLTANDDNLLNAEIYDGELFLDPFVEDVEDGTTLSIVYLGSYFYAFAASSGGSLPTLSGEAVFEEVTIGGQTDQYLKISGNCTLTWTAD